ncbi:MAG: YidC/Oxa1 family insertase periplasmic-domain containing protein [Planctomycetes bacterium]|nr:YidC/Oxa1 family insertase periplasmic-domain containing protein [Planctomycetota bacterium]
MDIKRFGLFLVLSWAVFIGFQMLQGPPPKPVPVEGAGGAQAGNPSGSQGAADGQTGGNSQGQANGALPPSGGPASMAAIGGEPWSETLLVGKPGEKGRYQVRFDSLGGVIAEMRTGDYYVTGHPKLDTSDVQYWMPLVKPIQTEAGRVGSMGLRAGPSASDLVPYDLERVHWDHEILTEGEDVVGVRFRHTVEASGLTIEKTLRTVPGKHEWDVQLALTGNGSARVGEMVRFVLTPAAGMVRSSSDPYYKEPKARACGVVGGEWELESKDVDPTGKKLVDTFSTGKEVLFGGVDNKYFAMLLRPADGVDGALARESVTDASWRLVGDLDWAAKKPQEAAKGPYHHALTDMGLNLKVPDAAQRLVWNYRLYAGPKEREEFIAALPAHEQLLRKDLGFFDGIATFLLKVLGTFHGWVGNWGVAIIMLTLTVRFALFPFNRRSQTAMAKHATKMKRVQPKINEAKEKYKNDPKKLREAQAKIMQEEGAFPPLGGCLPPLVQIPVFFGLFSALRVAFDLRQERFLWIEDLSMPDHLAHLGWNTHLPIVGVLDWFNILPLLMVVLWIVQQMVMPKPTDPQAAQMQKMMKWMPVMFGVFLYNYAAGLSLYMVTSSLFGIFEYTVVRKIWPLDETEPVKKAKGKLAMRLETAMKEAQRLQEQKKAIQPGKGTSKGQGKKKR